MSEPPKPKTPRRNRKSVRIADVAREAGVSVGLVSSFLSGNYYGKDRRAIVGVAHESGETILRACRKLQYQSERPDVQAFIYPETSVVSFLLTDRLPDGLTHPYFSRFFHGVAEQASKEGYHVYFGRFPRAKDFSKEPQELESLTMGGTSMRVILASDVNESLVRGLVARGAAVGYVSRHVDVPGTVSVVPDYFNAASMAVNEILKLGHRSIVFAQADYIKRDHYNHKELHRGCVVACAEFGVRMDVSKFIWLSERTDGEGLTIKPEDLDLLRDSTVVFCFDEYIAVQLEMILRGKGISVPDDISLVASGDALADLHHDITSVRYPLVEIGRQAYSEVTTLASSSARSEALPKRIVLPVEFVWRGSLREPKA